MAANSELFQHLNFLIVVSSVEGFEAAHITAQLLRSNGCNRCHVYEQYLEDELPKDESLKSWFLEKFGQTNVINFIISEDTRFPFYEIAAFDFLIPVVTSEWVTTCLSTNRHHRTSSFSPDERHVLKDLQIYVSRHAFNHSEYLLYTEMIHAMGGTCIDFLSSKTTHLVTQDPNDPAVKAVVGFGQAHSINFVFPTWIVECFKTLAVAALEGHSLDPKATVEATSEKLQDLWDNLDELAFKKTSTILENHSFLIGMDVSLNRNLYAMLIEFLQANGGTVVRHIDENDILVSKADCYIGGSVVSKEYDAALTVKMELGNLIWIFYMWSANQFVSPKIKLLFAPFKKKLFDTNELILSYSNYFGQQRFYIQRLAELLGGYSTGELSKKNTHLVSQFPWGKKFLTAKNWEKCTVINHLWLEMTYECGKILDPMEVRFQQYPVEGGLKGAIGQLCLNQTAHQPLSPMINSENSTRNAGKKSEGPGSLEKLVGTNVCDGGLEHKSPSQVDADMDNAKVSSDMPDTQGQAQSDFPDANTSHADTHFESSAHGAKASSVSQDDAEIASKPDAASFEHSEFSEAKTACIRMPNLVSSNNEDMDKTKGGTENSVGEKRFESPQENVASSSKQSDRIVTSVMMPDQSAALEIGHVAVQASDEKGISRAQTPRMSPSSSQTLHSSGGRRAAKAKAAEKLHNDIELLNEFQRNIKRRRTGDLLPDEIAQLERRKLLDREAEDILQKIWTGEDCDNTEESSRRRKHIYDMNAICTGSHEDIGELDKVLLEKIGIRVHEEITKENLSVLNTIIAPKQMRTAKFLKSFAFHPLKHALKPEFLSDLLHLVRELRPFPQLSLDLSDYSIPGVDTGRLLEMTSHPTKIFDRAGLLSVNLVSDITGGVEVITSILKSHGIREVKVVPTTRMNKLTFKDLIMNESPGPNPTQSVPDCVMIVTKSSQVKHFKRLVKNNCTAAMAVEWNWCISSIFALDVDYTDKQNVIFQQRSA